VNIVGRKNRVEPGVSCPRATRSAPPRTDGPPPSFAHEATTTSPGHFWGDETCRQVKSRKNAIAYTHWDHFAEAHRFRHGPRLTEEVVPSLTVTDMEPVSGFIGGPESSFRFTYWGWNRRDEWIAHRA